MNASKKTSGNSGLAQLGFQANFKVGFVLGSSVLNRYIWLTKSPTDAKPRDVVRYCTRNEINNTTHLKMIEKHKLFFFLTLIKTYEEEIQKLSETYRKKVDNLRQEKNEAVNELFSDYFK